MSNNSNNGKPKFKVTFGETIADEKGKITIPPEKSSSCKDFGVYMDIALTADNEKYNKNAAINARKAKEAKRAKRKTADRDGMSI